jgi:hypothetical protein
VLGDAEINDWIPVRGIRRNGGLACGTSDPTLAHTDGCSMTRGQRVRRHEVIKRALGNALSTAPGSQVQFEPLILQDPATSPEGARYNDVRFSGSAEANLPPMEFDVTSTSVITGLASQTLADSQQTGDNDAVEEATGQAQYRLYRAAQNKKNRLPPHISQGAVFHPVVISPGGLVETDTQRLLKVIGGKLGAGVMSWFDQTVSMGLVKLRAAARIRIEGLPQLSVRLARENSVELDMDL